MVKIVFRLCKGFMKKVDFIVWLSIFLVFLTIAINLTLGKIDDKYSVFLIGSAIALATLIGNQWISKSSKDSELKIERELRYREQKQAYYNKFIEALTLKYNKPNDPQVMNDFLVEVNRLPLYASGEVIELVNSVDANESEHIEQQYSSLYLKIRDDINNGEFEKLDKLENVSLRVVING
ncbi:hypothetical protein BBM18_18405 [Vibrio parahaemolyticus]|nr:hypothetical protein BBM18_18405 [Vibrio parahaemolyticus]